MAGASDSIEYQALRRCSSELTELIQHKLSLSTRFRERELVTDEVHGWVQTAQGVSDLDKANRLVSCLSDKVKSSRQSYHVFIDLLKNDPYFIDIVQKICAEHGMPVITSGSDILLYLLPLYDCRNIT